MENLASRTPQETFQDHGKALRTEDLDRILENFAEDAVFITAAGVKHGREGVREAFAQLFADLPRARWELKTQNFGGDILYLEWAADSDANRAEDGVDTFVFRDGLIQAMTVRYTLTPNS
ncbi:ketosteroid isomerase-like protein [Kitasatospora sp. MAA4]|uniref:nuclear transport factor 2 family protein n=1 Tax=Kitasatospora sp. MAA4 TaxID=3035093 RepID=UPI0024771B99|nr:nuclear transport factor 2 family protein [Kitasatospora sp. MAA4]MDH6131056.1 ketosteroid isomerase-like protein [Kitasatospora sp. MAA4]